MSSKNKKIKKKHREFNMALKKAIAKRTKANEQWLDKHFVYLGSNLFTVGDKK
jgi:hypothetical protein|tara:strand:+ start:253 stop:411 length:159 start_codon:yes stop_codon:yes gene_type:complete